MKFRYYSKKKADDVRFFTIRTNDDEEMLRIDTVSEEFGIKLIPEACGKYGFEYCYAVADGNITNIRLARERYNQIKEAAENLSEDEIFQRFYLTDEDGNEVREDFGTLDDVRKTAKELANIYHKDIYINTVIGEAIIDYESPDEEAETTEPCSECETSAEPEQNGIPQEAKDFPEEVVRPAVNALYKTGDELGKLLSAFAESCMIIQNVRPPP